MKRHSTLLFVSILKAATRSCISENHSSSNNSISNSSYTMNAYCFVNAKSTFVLSRVFFLLLFFLTSIIYLKAQETVTNTTVFPLNDYLTTEDGSPYPVLVQSKLDKIDTSKFVNVMDYGAAGDGVTWDDEAIANAFNDAKSGVIFPAGKTFLVHKTTTIYPKGDITVYAYGASIKMDSLCKYSFLSIEYTQEEYHNTVIWLGGTFYGNKKKQSWPGSPTGNDAWAESHGRFLGICYAEFALVKDVSVIGVVTDGVALEGCKLAVIADSKAYGGAPIRWSQDQEQGTYFKCTRSGSQAFYCMNLYCQGGSIGVHYSTKEVEEGSLTVVNNCQFLNQSQDAMHFEDCRKIFIYNSTVERDVDSDNQADVHISNRTEIASVKKCLFRNAKVDFRNASDLQIGVVDSCQFISEFTDDDTSSLLTFLAGGATHCINSSFVGKTDIEQAWADNVQNCTFTNFNSVGLKGCRAANRSNFDTGPEPITNAKDGVVVDCTFKNVGNSDYNKPDNKSWKKPFASSITIVNNKNKYLGTITCGKTDDDKDTVIGIGIGGINAGVSATASRTAPPPNNAQRNTSTASKKTISISSANATALNNSNAGMQISAIKLYPNPAVDEVHVTLNDKVWGKTVLNIYDQQGRLVQSKTVYKNAAGSTESINVRSLAAGNYMLHIINEHQQSSIKFIIRR